MSQRYSVQAIAKAGLRYYHRCGYAWPRGDGHVEIEVVADDKADAVKPGVAPNGVKIGETAFERMSKDPQLRIAPVVAPRQRPAAPVAPRAPAPPPAAASPTNHVPEETPAVAPKVRKKPGPKPKAKATEGGGEPTTE